ncbi:hypothetical protein MY04_5014 [Flammeovirga sp. MY04]|uniref:hypothetical protein n=1 Tax=Flammeovirga sp. MY04 TaxID=1191459 RepID=UPI00080639E4|nr:hypothetical protein [Flammeovirga sp. MY04]ANQ52349.1 hypothetical protein MY04_5014 [Flammeovirga sp. MY04]
MIHFPDKELIYSSNIPRYNEKEISILSILVLIIFDIVLILIFKTMIFKGLTFVIPFAIIFGIILAFGHYFFFMRYNSKILVNVYKDFIYIKKSSKRKGIIFHKSNIQQINAVRYEHKYKDKDGKDQVIISHQPMIKLKGGKEYKIDINDYSLNYVNNLTSSLNRSLNLKKVHHKKDSNNNKLRSISPKYLETLINRFKKGIEITLHIDSIPTKVIQIEKIEFKNEEKVYYDISVLNKLHQKVNYRIIQQNHRIGIYEIEKIDYKNIFKRSTYKNLKLNDLPEELNFRSDVFNINERINGMKLVRLAQKEGPDILIQKYQGNDDKLSIQFSCLDHGENYIFRCHFLKKHSLNKIEISNLEADNRNNKIIKNIKYNFLSEIDIYKSKTYKNLYTSKSYYDYANDVIKENYKEFVINEKVLELIDQPLRKIVSINNNDYFLVTKLIYITYNLSFHVIFRIENEKEKKLLYINNSGDLFELKKIYIHELFDKYVLKEKPYNKFPNILKYESIEYKKRQFYIGEQFNHEDEENKTTFFKFEYSDSSKENILLFSKMSGDNYMDGLVGKKIKNTLELN